jgi:hypothetical protein
MEDMKRLFSLIAILTLQVSPSIAGQLSDGTVFFDKSPRLRDFSATYQAVRVWAAKYYVTIDLPSNIGEPLGSVTIRQQDGIQTIPFLLDKTVAFVGTRDRQGQRLSLQSTTLDPETNTITVVFDPPVPPGTTVSIALKPFQNPDYGGIYQFRITTYPAGEKTTGLTLGVGRLTIYEAGDRW